MAEVIDSVAEEMGLPDWWVESIAIEYLDCREYAEWDESLGTGKALARFNWERIPKADLKTVVQEHKVVVHGGMLIHNIHTDVLPFRFASQMAGGDLPSVAGESDDIIPEGLVSDYHFPFRANSIAAEDPKTSFSQWFQVFDDGEFWQWRIAEFVAVEGSHRGKWASQELDLEPINNICEKRHLLRNSVIEPGQPGYDEFRQEVEQFYQWVNKARSQVLLNLWYIHLGKRSERKRKDFPKATNDQPPLLSRFESYTVRDNKLHTNFHVERIFYRCSVYHAGEAEKSEESIGNDRQLTVKLDEIYEERALAIITGAACVESLVNSLLMEYFPKVWKLVERLSAREKLDLYFLLKEKGKLSDIGNEANSFVVCLFRVRDLLMHFKRDYFPVMEYKKKTVTYISGQMNREFNLSLPTKLKELIAIMYAAAEQPKPIWLDEPLKQQQN